MRKLTNFMLIDGLLIMLVVIFYSIKPAYAVCGKVQSSMSPTAITARVEPVGFVWVDGSVAVAAEAPAALGPDAGKKRYDTSCALCHAQGIAGSPKLTDKAAWEPRIAKGIDGMLETAIKGKGGMPPRGTCMSCSDEELKLTIEYMVEQVKKN